VTDTDEEDEHPLGSARDVLALHAVAVVCLSAIMIAATGSVVALSIKLSVWAWRSTMGS
jgi:hypothetical protein